MKDRQEVYSSLQDTLEKAGKRNNIIIMGDFNANIGLERAKDEEKVRGLYGIGHRNQRLKK